MGIRKVTGFVKHNYEWKYTIVRGKVVIDGYSLCYHLYSENHEWEMGGEYHEFYKTVTKYFRQLQQMGIVPYVVIDGIDHDNSKYSTVVERCEQKIERIANMKFEGTSTVAEAVLPLLAKTVFVDAVRDFELDFFIADGEADQDVVSLANHLRCPVLGRDSDFFIFNVDGGYIPISDPVDGGRAVDLSQKVRFFSYQDFDAQFSLSSDFRLFLPFFLGNDFLEGLVSPILGIDHTTAVHKILSTVKRHFKGDHDIDSILSGHGRDTVERMENVRRFYRVLPRSFKDLATSRHLCRVNSRIPPWIVDLYKKGQFLHTMMQFMVCQSDKTWRYTNVVEDVKQTSAWEVSRRVRYFIIAFVLHDVESRARIYETVRQASSPRAQRRYCLVKEAVALGREHRDVLPVALSILPSHPREARRDVFLRVLQCEDVSRLIESCIPEDLKLVVIASRFWLKATRHDIASQLLSVIDALVWCILVCSGKIRAPDSSGTHTPERISRLAFVHAFARWQCVLHDAVALNQVLGQPFMYTSPGKLFSAIVLEKLIGLQLPKTKLFKDMVAAISEAEATTEQLAGLTV